MPARLVVENLTKRFGSGETEVVAVDDISLQIDEGEVVLVMGPSGSGKTTLLLMLGGLLKPTSGSIKLDGQDITQLGEAKLPGIRLHKVGFVFQDFHLLSALSVRENVALVAMLAGASRPSALRRSDEALTSMGLEARLRYAPENLSGGEKQRVAIARALINDPALILGDEPTANLDSKIGHDIARLLHDVAKTKGKSVVVVSHDQRLREHADRVIWLEDGQIKELEAMVVDPVCGMAIEQDRAVRLDLSGVTHWFCSRGCRSEFMEDRARKPTSQGADVA